MEAVYRMIDVIAAFAIPGVSKLFGEELVYALKMRYEGRDEWLEYLFEAYLDCKQMAVEIAATL